MAEANIKLATLKGQLAEGQLLQKKQLDAAAQAHEFIHANHHPVRVQAILDAVNTVEDRTAADVCVVASILLAGAVVSSGADGGALLLGTGSMVNQMVQQSILAAAAEASEFDADVAALEKEVG